MTEPKRFKKGKHTYTRWGHNFKEVRVDAPTSGPPPLSIDVDSQTAAGVYANLTLAHRSSDEIVLDFLFRPPGQTKARIRSRVVLSHLEAERVAKLLGRTVQEIKKGTAK